MAILWQIAFFSGLLTNLVVVSSVANLCDPEMEKRELQSSKGRRTHIVPLGHACKTKKWEGLVACKIKSAKKLYAKIT